MDLSKLCLDTSAYSYFKRGHLPLVALLDEASWVGVPAVVLGELRTGFALGARQGDNERELARFLHHPSVQVLDVDDEAASLYTELVVNLRRAGTPLPTNDIWIAAVAARENATVVTLDHHFESIHRVSRHVLAVPG